MRTIALPVAAGIALAVSIPRVGAGPTPPLEPDIPAQFTPRGPAADFERRDVMIPMRDGVKLHTVIVVPRGARRAPIVLTRTPYNATKHAERTPSLAMAATVGPGDELLATAGYIVVYQDVRGKYGSEGDYVMTRPLRGPLNDSKVDHATDAYDTIDWLVKVPARAMGPLDFDGDTALAWRRDVMRPFLDAHLKDGAPAAATPPVLAYDQRAVADRTDVLTYATAPLTAPIKIAGAPQVTLFASTTGSDADWIVELPIAP